MIEIGLLDPQVVLHEVDLVEIPPIISFIIAASIEWHVEFNTNFFIFFIVVIILFVKTLSLLQTANLLPIA